MMTILASQKSCKKNGTNSATEINVDTDTVCKVSARYDNWCPS